MSVHSTLYTRLRGHDGKMMIFQVAHNPTDYEQLWQTRRVR